MSELGKQIKEEIETLNNYFDTPEGKQERVKHIVMLVDELDKSYEALRTAVLGERRKRKMDEFMGIQAPHYNSKKGIIAGMRDDAARELGLRYGEIE